MTITDESAMRSFFGHEPAMPGGSSPWASAYGRELRDAIVRQAHRQPRSVQRSLGPSELGAECLTGETEIVTRQGIRTIAGLAKEGSAELLVPMLYRGSEVRKRWGRFIQVPVEYFGEQEVFEITLRRNQDTKTVFATANHHWYRSYWSGAQQKQRSQQRLETHELRPGHRLQQLRRAMPRSTTLMPVAVAQGFTFGDGTKGDDYGSKHRPARLSLYHNGKDEALLPYFPGDHRTYPPSGAHAHAYTLVRGLPRFWKHLPPIDESVSFLMSWLAGYFAADGSVTEDGHCKIDSACREHLEFVRDVAAVCGIGYGQVQKNMRRGISGTRPAPSKTPLYRLSLRRRDLPDWFFLIEKHAQRAKAASLAIERDPFWIVESVRATGRTESVYCAITGDASAFALADDLMTGNCDRQVVSKMCGEPVTNHVADPWPSVVGTAVHAWLAEKFDNENRLNGQARWLTEQRVMPHPLYPGTSDVYDAATQTVVDWKVLGPTSLAKLQRPDGPPQRYVIQLLLYAWGWRNAGFPVTRVAIAGLPRTAPSLAEMYVWDRYLTPDDDQIVIGILQLTEARRAAAQLVLSGQLPISQVRRVPGSDECYFCNFYRPEAAREGGPGCPGHSAVA